MIVVLLLLSTSFPLPALASLFRISNSMKFVSSTEAPQKVPPISYVSGPQSVIVILVSFKDVASTKSRDELKEFVFTRVNSYFKNVSYGALWLTENVTSQWYQLPRSRSYYAAGMASSERTTDLIVDAVRAADREVNYMNYNYIMIVYAGDDQDRSMNPNDITSGGVYGNGYPISTNEGTLGFGVSWLSEMDPLGPYAHYLALNFRLPSLLNPKTPLSDDFVAEWDLMGHGFWANNGSTPVEPTSWCRIRLGWINESQIVQVNATESKTVDIDQLETSPNGVKAVKLPISRHVYYLIEVRKKVGYDAYLPDDGVLILYVNEGLEQGQGIVRVIDSTALTRTLNDAPFKVGGIFENQTGNIAVEVLSESNSSYKVSVSRSGTGHPISAYLTVNIPFSGIFVRIDGINLTADAKNQVQKLMRIGLHAVEVPNTVYITDTSRVIFNGWTDGNSTNPRALVVNENSTLTANYKLQNLLQVLSAYGSPTGSGWYDANTVATFSVTRVVEYGNGTRRAFLSWTNDSNDASPTGQIEMNKPRTIIAKWKTQYAIQFTATGLKNGSTVMLAVNGQNKTYTVPFNEVAWFDQGSMLSFRASPSTVISGFVTFRFKQWTQEGKTVTSPMTITQPAKLIAVYGSEWPFPASSDQTSSNILTASWRTYLQIASRVLNALSSHQGLFTAFLVIAYPFFAIVDFARELYLTFSFESIISGTGIALAASVLLGLIYLFPVSILIVGFDRWKRHRIPQMRMLLPVVLLWVVGIVLAVTGTLATIETIGVGGFAALAFATALLSALIPATRIVGLKKPSPSKENTRQ